MNQEIARQIAQEIVADYGKARPIDKLEISNQPEKAAVIGVLDRLRAILFAGYFRDRETKLYDVRTGLYAMVEDCMYRLQKQITTVLPYLPQWANQPEDVLTAEAERLTQVFFERIPAVRAILDTDLQAILDGDPAAANKDEIIYSYPGFFTISVYRLAHELFLLGIPMIPRMMSEHAHSLTGIDIHPGADISRSFFIDHGTGIVIGETTVIGEHVKLYQGVTLGALSTRGGQALKGVKRHPTLEDNVTIYAGASVLGNTLIGHDSVIGGNVFITEDVPPCTRVSLQRQDLVYRPKNH